MKYIPLLLTSASMCLTAHAHAGIFQYFDGDGNGSLFLSDIDAGPFADLSGQTLHWANLSLTDLSGVNFSNSDLSHADLSSSTLTNSYLHSTNISNADLSNTTMTYSYLFGAQLNDSDLSYSDLSYAYLVFADLSYADLSYADLSNATLTESNLQGADLSGADMSNLCCCFNANFEDATYDADTQFAEGMDPHAMGMIFLPAPASLALLAINAFMLKPRRQRLACHRNMITPARTDMD